MRILVAGAGGVGGYLAARLAAAGEKVFVLARGAHLAAIREKGLVLRDGGSTVTVRLPAADNVPAFGQAELVIYAVKGPDLAGAVEITRPAFGEGTLALPFLNGVEAHEILARAFGCKRTLIGVARIFAHIEKPGTVVKASPFASFTIGNFDGRQDVPPVREIMACFRGAGLDVLDCDDVRVDLWRKFVMLTATAGTTAAARVDVGRVRETPELWALYRRLAEETLAVAQAKGVALGEEAVTQAIAAARAMPGELRASLAHDLAAGKPLESDWLMGAVARLARAAGIEAPANAAVAAILAPWKKGAGSRRDESTADSKGSASEA